MAKEVTLTVLSTSKPSEPARQQVTLTVLSQQPELQPQPQPQPQPIAPVAERRKTPALEERSQSNK